MHWQIDIGSDLDCQDLIAAGDRNGNTEPTQKDEKTEDEADKVCLVNHTTSRSERERTGQRVMASA